MLAHMSKAKGHTLVGSGLEPPEIAPESAPRAGVAQYQPEGHKHGRRPGALVHDPPSEAVWEAMIEAYRLHPGHHINAAAQAKVTPAYAKLAWDNGWWKTAGYERYIPIRDIVAAEQATARAALVKSGAKPTPATVQEARTEARSVVQNAVVDLEEARVGEARLVRTLRQFAMSSLAALAPIKQVLPEITKRLAEQLRTEKLTPKEAVSLMRAIEEISRNATEQAKIAVELERRVLGEPDLTIDHRVVADAPENLEAAMREIQEAEEARQRVLASRNIIDVDATEVGDAGEDIPEEFDDAS